MVFMYCGVHVELSLEDRICRILNGHSSECIFLYTILSAYCKVNNITCRRYNLDTCNEVFIPDFGLVLLSETDFYLTPRLFNKFENSDAIILFSSINTLDYISSDMGDYMVLSTDTELRLDKCG